jgi:uncharacterized membrane protein
MRIEKTFAGRRHEVSRLEGFSDAVFAFAVTLLVVSLEVPRTFDELLLAMRGFLAFAICFALLFQVWWRHHAYFRRYGLEDPVTKALTGVLLFVVLFYVYPLKFLWTLVIGGQLFGTTARFADGHVEPMIRDAQVPHLFEIYGLGVFAVFSVFVALYLHAYRLRGALGLTPDEALQTRLSVLSNAALAGVGLVSATIAWIGGRRGAFWAGMVYWSIGAIEWAIGEYGGRKRRQLEGPANAGHYIPK